MGQIWHTHKGDNGDIRLISYCSYFHFFITEIVKYNELGINQSVHRRGTEITIGCGETLILGFHEKEVARKCIKNDNFWSQNLGIYVSAVRFICLFIADATTFYNQTFY